jgi:hypothetical protein
MDEAGSETFTEKSQAFLKFMKDYELANGSISDGHGNKVTAKRNKYGFYTMSVTSRIHDKECEEDNE